MAKVQFSLEGNSFGEYALDKERMTIGRRTSNDIHIDNLAVSGEHAVIVTIGNDSFLEDLNSTNGTLVNNKPIKKYVLNHGDVMEFGKYQLTYINENQVKSVANTGHNGFAPTVSVEPKPSATVEVAPSKPVNLEITQAMPAVNTNALAPSQASLPELMGKLQVLNGTSSGRELLLNKTLTTLGKPGGQVAVITKRGNGYFITHVGGDSLPSVNGQQIGPQAHALNDHDVLELAGLKMEFYLAETVSSD
jgi:pSer/pThr/pTyr-binding forkhead associated (FHA) protein